MSNGLGNRVCVIVNQDSGTGDSVGAMRLAVAEYSEQPCTTVEFLCSENNADGRQKARQAVENGVDTVVVVGGDGTINSIAGALIDTPVSLAAIPAGSGNGFARHFGISLDPLRAFRDLSAGHRTQMDVGYADGRPFFVTCSMAWDAALVPVFEKSPFRGILSYIVAGIYEFFEYTPQDIAVEIDHQHTVVFREPLVFTIANLSQYGGGAVIAPDARADDGKLELIAASRTTLPRVIARLPRLFNRTVTDMPEICSLKISSLTVRRHRATPVQIDGETCDLPLECRIEVRPGALNVVVPHCT
jgi:YegS/Rv2252/BmrU family lipid kinase